MGAVVTLGERKAAEATRKTAAVSALRPVLAEYARAHGGRFLLFGTAARGGMKWDSDVDLLLDFPEEAMSAAWVFAERACWDLELEPDIHWLSGCKPAFLAHIAAEVVVLA